MDDEASAGEAAVDDEASAGEAAVDEPAPAAGVTTTPRPLRTAAKPATPTSTVRHTKTTVHTTLCVPSASVGSMSSG